MFVDEKVQDPGAGAAGGRGVAGTPVALDGLTDGQLLDVAVAALRRVGSTPLTAAICDEALTASLPVLQRLATMAEAEKLRRVTEIDSRAVFNGQTRSTPDLLAATCDLSPAEARRQYGLAGALSELPQTAGALASGEINLPQAKEAGRVLQHLRDAAVAGGLTGQQLHDAVGRVDRLTTKHRRGHDLRGLRRDLDELATRAGSNHLAAQERRAHARRHLWWAPGEGPDEGLTRLEGLLDAVTATKLQTMLASLARPAGDDDTRTVGQRRHDALAHLCDLAADNKAAGTQPETVVPRAQVLLLTTPDALHGQPDASPSLLDGYGPVSSATARQMCCHADLTPITVTRNGTVLDVGRSLRFPTSVQRRAVIARDRVCIGCGAPALTCQVHHITWWNHGGRSDLDNLTLLCPACHTNVHHFGWTITPTNNGGYTAQPPTRDPTKPAHDDSG